MKIPVCSKCGSREIRSDGYAKWEPREQDWVLADTFDNTDCLNCGGECGIKWVEVDAPAAMTTNDIGILIADLIDDTSCFNPDNGRADVNHVDRSDASNLHVTLDNGQTFTVRIISP